MDWHTHTQGGGVNMEKYPALNSGVWRVMFTLSTSGILTYHFRRPPPNRNDLSWFKYTNCSQRTTSPNTQSKILTIWVKKGIRLKIGLQFLLNGSIQLIFKLKASKREKLYWWLPLDDQKYQSWHIYLFGISLPTRCDVTPYYMHTN